MERLFVGEVHAFFRKFRLKTRESVIKHHLSLKDWQTMTYGQ
jgi:hypothetical protein